MSAPSRAASTCGLTDLAYALIPNIEAGRAARWAWEEPAAGVQ